MTDRLATTGPPTREVVLEALRDVYDPCCEDRGISIVDMGVVDDVRVDPAGGVEVDLVPTAGWCPFTVNMSTAIPNRLRSLGVDPAKVKVEPRFERVWTFDRLSESARAKLSLPLEELLPYREQRLAEAEQGRG